MKKLIKTLLTLALAAGMLMSLGVTAYADSTELPSVSVGYGYGCPDAAAVDMHGAAAEELTLDGIAIELRCEDGTAYIRVTDLAAVKLLRESTAKITELGIDLSKLYIKDGLILIKEDGMTADEVAELEAKISELTRTATIKLSVGDKFALGSGGVAAVYIEIGGFNAPPAQEAEEKKAPAEEPTPKRQLKVEACGLSINSNTPKIVSLPSGTPEVTTLYVSYGKDDLLYNDTLYKSSENKNIYEPGVSTCNYSYIILLKSEGDTTTYYYKTSSTGKYEKLENKTPVEIIQCMMYKESTNKGIIPYAREEIDDVVNNTEISISTTNDGSGEIVNIKYRNDTPKTIDPSNPPPGYVKYSSDTDRNPTYSPTENDENLITIVSAEEGKTVDEAHKLTASIKNTIDCINHESPYTQSTSNKSEPMVTNLTGESNPTPVVIDTDGESNPTGGGNPNPVKTEPTEPQGETETTNE